MKKILFYSLCFIIIPFLTYAMDNISDFELDGITGASGVSIKFYGDLTLDIDMIKIGWGDTDGIGGGTSQCFLTLEATGNPSLTKARLSTSNPTFAIDVATTGSSALSIGGKLAVEAETTFVKIDLPDDITAEITTCEYTDFKLVEDPLNGGGNSFGRLQTKNLKIYIQEFPTDIYISAHN